MKNKILRASCIMVGAFAVLTLATFCFNPVSFLDEKEEPEGTCSLTVSLAVPGAGSVAQGRTVTADILGSVTQWTATVTRADGTGAPHTVSTAATTMSINGIVPATWNLVVTGTTAGGIAVLSGTVNNIEVALGEIVPVTVPVSLIGTGTGSFSLTLSFPASTAIDYATATINGSTLTPPVNTASDPNTVVFASSGLTAGMYNLVFTLKRGGASGVSAGTFIEAVNIYTGLTSDKWVLPDGTLGTSWSLSAGNLFSSNAFLSALTTDAGILTFSSTNFTPSVTTSTAVVGFTPTGSVDGQLIEYSTDNATWTTILSGDTTPSLTPPGTCYIRVRSPDRVTTNTYAISMNRNLTMSYYPNDSSGLTFSETTPAGGSYTIRTTSGAGFGNPLHDGITLRFAGWNTKSDGTGMSYASGAIVSPIASALTLYAQWSIIGGLGPAGGYVFYDKGEYSAGWRYMEVYDPSSGVADAPSVVTNGANALLGTSPNVGTGKANTLLFLPAATSGSAFTCAGFSSGGFDDWFLPSSGDMGAIKTNLWTALALGSFLTGGSDYYATSSEADATQIIALNMGASGTTANFSKTAGSVYFRPVRAFAGPVASQVLLYNANGGTGGIASSGAFFYPKSTTVTVSDGTGIAKLPDSFVCWTTKSDGTGALYRQDGLSTADDVIALANDTILYARWIPLSESEMLTDVIRDGGSFTLPVECTSTELLLVGDAVYEATAPVSLDLSAVVVTPFPTSTFNGCLMLESIVLSDDLLVIGNNCFAGCVNLSSVVLGSGVTNIDVGAFHDCAALVTIELPASVTTIGGSAFAGSGMVTVGGTLTCLALSPPTLGSNVFGSNPVPAFVIKVPSASLPAYIGAAGWSNYADHLQAI